MSTTLETETGYINIDKAMALARAKYTAHPEFLSDTKMPTHISITDDLDFEERVGVAYARTKNLISQAKAQLAAPACSPHATACAERDERWDREKWEEGLYKAEKISNRMGERNDRLFQYVMCEVERAEVDGVVIPEDVRVPSSPVTQELGCLIAVPADVCAWISMSKKALEHYVVVQKKRDGAESCRNGKCQVQSELTSGLDRLQTRSTTLSGARSRGNPRTGKTIEATTNTVRKNSKSSPAQAAAHHLTDGHTSESGVRAQLPRRKASWQTLASWDVKYTW